MSANCTDHDWQAAKDLTNGRYRCVACGAIGYRDPRGSGKIVEYARVPDWVRKDKGFEDYESYYPMGENGRCPTMQEQEAYMLGSRGSEDEPNV